jgi:hypothetical protein
MKFKLNQDQIDFYLKNIENAERVLEADTLRELLLPLDAFISEEGMDAEYILTEQGIRAQKIYDEIYFANS